jgi:hypothetical protein
VVTRLLPQTRSVGPSEGLESLTVARQRDSRSLPFAQLNVALATASVHGDRPVTRWSAVRAMAGALTTATRVGEFIAMWAIAKHRLGEVTTERVAEFWEMNERTAYRRLDEFREVWGPPGLTRRLETPDEVADLLIAEYERRQKRLGRSALSGVAGTEFELPAGWASPDLNVSA